MFGILKVFCKRNFNWKYVYDKLSFIPMNEWYFTKNVYRGSYTVAQTYRGHYMHGCAEIQILSWSVDNISYEWAKQTSEKCFQHKKIKTYLQAAM